MQEVGHLNKYPYQAFGEVQFGDVRVGESIEDLEGKRAKPRILIRGEITT